MDQEVYFNRWPSLEAISGVYSISSLFLLIGVALFCAILLIAIISLVRIVIAIRRVHREQQMVYHDMDTFYKKQLKLLHGKQFLHSLYQYTKLLVQLGKGKDMHSIWHTLGYDNTTIQYMEKTIMEGNELDYEEEKRIKDILHQHIG